MKHVGSYYYSEAMKLFEAFAKPLEWLLAVAGPAVVAAPAVTQTLMQVCQDMPGFWQEAVPGIAFRHGMQLSAEQLVAAAKQRLRGMDSWFDAVGRQLACREPSIVGDKATMMHYIDWVCGKPQDWENQHGALLRKLTSEQLQDLLLIAVNMPDSWAAECIRHACRENNRLMYARCSTSSSSAAAAGDSSDDSSSSSSSSLVQLVQHLLTTAMIRGHYELAGGFADAPPAQQLSPQAVAKLLSLRMQLESPREGNSPVYLAEQEAIERSLSAFKAILQLPGARAMQSDSLASLISLACKRGHLHLLQCLIDAVPAAQQLPSRALCGALLAAGAAGKRQLAEQLAELQSAQQLAPGDAAWLLKQLLHKPWGEGLWQVLEDLAAMQLRSQLTGGELLQLLREAIRSDDEGAFSDLADLKLAAHQIDDIGGYTALLQEAMRSSVDLDVLCGTAKDLPVTQLLPVETVLDFCLRGIKGDLQLLDFLFELPAVSNFSTAAIEQLLLAMLPQKHAGLLPTVAVLLKAPGAAQLSVDTLTAVLRYAVQELRVRNYWEEGKQFAF
ncbi:hypothetical protein OEZ86_008902 [Tetradesmus obliquus]|nr:hypothetical protein OEZ86_008902 [Tetradesmus obliquus]